MLINPCPLAPPSSVDLVRSKSFRQKTASAQKREREEASKREAMRREKERQKNKNAFKVSRRPTYFADYIMDRTEFYDASKGEFVDIGILDGLQIFGRAGRPASCYLLFSLHLSPATHHQC